jgi:signal transduction histidine kinase
MEQRVLNPRFVLKSLTLFLAYFLASEIGFTLFAPPAVFPLAAGVALAGLVLGGLELAPIIFLAAVAESFFHSGSLVIGLALAVGNTVQAFVGAYVLRMFRFDPLMRRMRDIFSIGAVGLVISTIVPTVVLVAFIVNENLGGRGSPISWFSYWTGDMWTLLIVSPLIIRWLAKPFFVRTWSEALETIAAFAFLFFCDYLVFWTKNPQVGGVSFVYLMLVPFFWLALRLSPRFVTLALTLTSILAFAGATGGPGVAISTMSLGARLSSLQVFMVVISLIFYILESIANERRYAIAALKEQVSRLETALKRISSEDLAKTEFLSVLAHELRNPLAPIVSGLELLKLPQTKSEEGSRIIEMMNGRVGVISRLLEDLLDVSRISRRKLILKAEQVELSALLERSVSSVNEFNVQKTHSCTLVLPASPVYVRADPVRLEQVFINILKNAVKYSPPKQEVFVTLETQENTATVRIRDNGIGIEPNMMERIFEPFIQADTLKTTEGGSGLGIGLWLTKQLIEMHDGTIQVRSDGTNKGSEFTVCLPLLQSVVLASSPVMPATVPTSKRFSRILVVDDNVPAAEGIGKLLTHGGHSTDLAFSGVDAITRVKVFRPDVILLDVGLPDMTGYEVARTLRAIDQFSGKLVALTGYGQEEDKNKAYAAGFDLHITKPVSIKDLEEMLAR